MAFLDGLGQAFKAIDCALLSGGDYILGGIGRFTGLDQGLAQNAINALRRLRGCSPDNDAEPPEPSFAGGQCPEPYVITVTTTRVEPNPPEALTFLARGPILGVRVEPISPTSAAVQINCTGISFNGGVCSGLSNGGQGFRTIVAGSVYIDQSASITSISACGSDNCGDLPAPYPPPSVTNIDIDVEFLDEGDNIVNVTIPVEFKPFTVNFNGDVAFPFEFSLGGLSFEGTVSFSPEFNLNVRPKDRPSPTTDEPIPPGPPEEDVPRSEPGEKIVGVVVISEIQSDASVGSIDFVGGPDTFIPRAGSVKFAYSIGGATFWSSDIDVKTLRTFIPCPFSQGADAVVATPNPGITSRAIPIRGFPLATVADLVTPA